VNRFMMLCAAGLVMTMAADVVRADPPTLVVKKAPPTVGHQSFDPRHPPKQMPPPVPGKAGLCHYEFTTDIRAGGDIDQVAPGQIKLTVDTIEINLSLPITIWLAPNAPKRILEHEEGHRQICEYYYANAEVYARRAADAYMGKAFTGQGKDKQAAVDNAMDQVILAISKQIMDQTRVRAVACNDRYDKITDHSRNPGVQSEAAVKAEGEDPEPKGGKPAESASAAAPAKN
jgi:hypothetical protein